LELLFVDSVSAYHGSIEAIHDVTLSVDRGEVVGVFGPNGAGKSTLLRSVMGLIKISDGRIRLGGEDIAGLAPHRIVSRGVAYVPEGRRIFPMMTVEENLGVAVPRGCPDVREREAEAFSLFPKLEEKRSEQAGQLSGGEQQMLAIARALMSRPRLLVVDEPSLGLSPAAVSRVVEAIEALAKGGVAILLAEQNLDLALGVSGRVYVFENGRVLFGGRSDELSGDPRLTVTFHAGMV
jgi:branched-chain amino acid transport system ATP-binding protein